MAGEMHGGGLERARCAVHGAARWTKILHGWLANHKTYATIIRHAQKDTHALHHGTA